MHRPVGVSGRLMGYACPFGLMPLACTYVTMRHLQAPMSYLTHQTCFSTLQVILCHNHLISQKEVNHALTHELLHAYDHCRGANIDWHNCNHHACSEIRAASLSGDCNWGQEVQRGNYGIRKQHQVCVKRRAELSLSMNPPCQGLRGKLAVDSVFDSCYKDTTPFDRIP